MPLIQEVPLCEKTKNGNFNLLVNPLFIDDLIKTIEESLSISQCVMSYSPTEKEFSRAKRLQAYKQLLTNAKKKQP